MRVFLLFHMTNYYKNSGEFLGVFKTFKEVDARRHSIWANRNGSATHSQIYDKDDLVIEERVL